MSLIRIRGYVVLEVYVGVTTARYAKVYDPVTLNKSDIQITRNLYNSLCTQITTTYTEEARVGLQGRKKNKRAWESYEKRPTRYKVLIKFIQWLAKCPK